jgi:ribosomal protein S18 acetylase RimI-like enzyme
MDTDEISIEKVTAFSKNIADGVRRLTKQIGQNYKPLSDDDLREMLKNPWNNLLIARDRQDKLAGMITLIVYRIPYVRKAYIEDLVVDVSWRGKGIATLLFDRAVSIAKENGAAYIDLTARPRREESNTLYHKLGFKKRDTNVYRLVFDYGEI